MPIYEYRCEKCGKVFEVMQSMNAKPLETCGEHCVAPGKPGDGKVTKLLSATAVHASGSHETRAAPVSPSCEQCDLRGGKCMFSPD